MTVCKKNRTYVVYFGVLMLLLLPNTVVAHSNVLYDISLDFDPELRKEIIHSAQAHLKIQETPVRFDYDKELLVVRFDRELEYSVEVNPSDYSIYGFRDDSLSVVRDAVYGPQERKKIAEEVFSKIPLEAQEELVYVGEDELYSGVYELSWHRYVNGVPVLDENFKVEVNPTTGKVVAWRLSIFWYSKDNMVTNPAFASSVAEILALVKFNGQPAEYIPQLTIVKNRPAWIIKIKTLYPIYVAVDALDGNVIFTGGIRGELPKENPVNTQIPLIETDYIRSLMEGKP